MGILGELWVKLGLKNDNLKKGLKDSEQSVSKFSQGIKKLGGAIAAAFAVEKIVAFGKQCAELANQVAGVKRAFDRIADPNLLKDLRKATQGTVTDLQLMQRAVQANNFKIPLDQLATYLEFATKRAQETGQSVDYLVDSIVMGLGRQSLLILDNLGFSAKEIRDNMKDGSTMAEAVGKIIKKEMGGATTAMNNAETASQRFGASLKNMMVAIGEGTGIKNAWNATLGWMAEKFNKITQVMELESVGTGIKLMNVLSGGIIGGSLIDELIEKEAIANTPDGPEIPVGVKITRNDGTQQTQEEAEAVRGLINELEKEIKDKTDIRNLSANSDEVDKLNDEIKALEEKLKLLKMTKAERVDYYKSQQVQIEKIDGIFDLDLMQDNLSKGKALLDASYLEWQKKGQQFVAMELEQQAKLDAMNEHFNAAIVAGISQGVQELTRVLAGVEEADMGTVMQALLTPMADALTRAGEMIIAEGIAVEAFKDSLKSLNGWAAIGAGTALVAVASAVKTGLQAIGNNPTSANGTMNNAVTSFTGGYGINPNSYMQNNNFALTTTLKGQDLLLSIERTQQNNRR